MNIFTVLQSGSDPIGSKNLAVTLGVDKKRGLKKERATRSARVSGRVACDPERVSRRRIVANAVLSDIHLNSGIRGIGCRSVKQIASELSNY